jgi:hypothetical protein
METHNIHTQGDSDVGMGIGVIVGLVVMAGRKEGDGDAPLWV